jgi:peptide/nickel transport system ATP-binding protein
MEKNLVEIKNLKTYFHTEDGVIKAVDDVSFNIREGETIGIVGESGCGKSITAMSLIRLIPDPPGKIEGGEIIFDGKKILKLNDEQIRSIRGNNISVIFQEPMTSLNPVFTIGYQISEITNLWIEVRHEGGDLGWRYVRNVDCHNERYHAGTTRSAVRRDL